MLITRAFPAFKEGLKTELDKAGELSLCNKGEILVQKGEEITHATLLLSGCLKISRENEKKQEFIITFLQAGQSFAVSVSDDSSIRNKKAFATIRATEPSYILKISYADKDALAKKYDQWYKYILQTAVMYYQFYIELIDNISYWNLDQRLKYFLVQLAEIRNSKTLKITHQEIANSLNSSRESVSRLLKKLEKENKISMNTKNIQILSSLDMGIQN